MSVTDEVERFECPRCGGLASANVRAAASWQDKGAPTHALSQIACHDAGSEISKRAAQLAIGICPECEHRMVRVAAVDQSLSTHNDDWFCRFCDERQGSAPARF